MKIIGSSNKLAPSKNNGSKLAFSRNNNSKLVSERNNDNNEVNKFCVDRNYIEYAKKSGKLFRLEKLKGKKLSKS